MGAEKLKNQNSSIAVIEGFQRANDEYFLIIHIERWRTKEEFPIKAQR
ncbi:MAG: hypothetical protein QXW43_06115 [Candidatus Methanomethyliaceae archaeon]